MTPRFDAVLFDLDGTLTESHPGIMHCASLALGEMGLPIPDEATLRRFIGPPLWYSYTEFCGLTPEQAEEAVVRYRKHYRDGGFLECSVYPGILPLLDDLRAAGVKLAVATAKPAKMAHAVCESFGILERVDFLSGNREDEKGMGKRGLIESACAGLGELQTVFTANGWTARTAVCMVLLCLMHAEGPYRVDLRRLRIRRAKLLQIMRIGLPAGVQGAIFSISNVLIQSSINSFGSVAMAGNSAASNLEGFIYTSMNAVYQTSLNFTSQNLGAGKRSRLIPILLRCLGVVFAVGALLGLIFYLLRYPLLGVYTSDPEVVTFGILRLELICSTYFLCGMMEVCCGSLRGLGYSVLPTVVSLTGACGLRVVWIFTVFAIDRSLWTLYLSYPVSWGLTALAHFICFLIVLKRQGGTQDVPPQTAAAK